MVISVYDLKFKCGCNKGLNFLEKEDILKKLNSIIEWDFCTFPLKNIEDNNEEDKNFLGEIPELKPGNCFELDGQIISIDSENKLVLLLSETGVLSLNRIYTDKIEPEYDLLTYKSKSTGEIKVDWCEIDEIPNDLETITPDYCYMKLWHDRFCNGRLANKHARVKVTVDNLFIYPITVYLDDWSLYFDKEDIFISENDESNNSIIKLIAKEIFSWFYKNYKRLIYEKQKSAEEISNREIDETKN